MPLDRRTFVTSLASAGTLAACGGNPGFGPAGTATAPLGRPGGGAAAAGVPMTIANNSGWETSKITLYILGYQPNGSCAAGDAVYLNSSKQLVKMGSSPVPGLPLSSFLSFDLPYLISGRVYVAIGGKLSIPVSGGAPTLPDGWDPKLPSGATNPNYDVRFDWFEYTCCGKGEPFVCNTTQVDMFGLPLYLQPSPSSKNAPGKYSSVGVPGGSYSKIFSQMSSTPDFEKLVISSGGKQIRIIAPGHGIEHGVFPSDYLDSYINSVISHYKSNTMTLCTDAYGIYKGKVSGSNFVFTYSSGSASCGSQSGNVPSVSIPTSYLTSQNVFECNVPGGTAGAAARIYAELYAGFNRGTLLLDPSNQPDFDKSDFYKASPTNLYSSIIHANSNEGLAYGFADDDQGGFSSTLTNTGIASFNMIIASLS